MRINCKEFKTPYAHLNTDIHDIQFSWPQLRHAVVTMGSPSLRAAMPSTQHAFAFALHKIFALESVIDIDDQGMLQLPDRYEDLDQSEKGVLSYWLGMCVTKVVAAEILDVPVAGLVWAVQRPETSFGVMLGMAALAGVGGGNFASSMANISFFYPQTEKGRALGLNAAGGNIGTAAVQFAVPVAIATAAGVQLERAGLIFVPLILLAAVLAWRFMDNLTCARAEPELFAAAARYRHTWIISAIYIGTFGSFIGFAAAFPTLLRAQFPEVTLSIAFTGALVGSLARPLGGILADRIGGARVTIAAFLVMAAGTLGAIAALRAHNFALFLGSFLVLFTATGAGNGSVYRMIPAVFRTTATTDEQRASAAKVAAGCIGIAGAVGAIGGFLVPRAFALSTSSTGGIEAALWGVLLSYIVFIATTWLVYARRGSAHGAGAV